METNGRVGGGQYSHHHRHHHCHHQQHHHPHPHHSHRHSHSHCHYCHHFNVYCTGHVCHHDDDSYQKYYRKLFKYDEDENKVDNSELINDRNKVHRYHRHRPHRYQDHCVHLWERLGCI